MAQTFRTTNITATTLDYSIDRFLANTTINSTQIQVGVATKPIDRIVVFMLEFNSFAQQIEYNNVSVQNILDYTVIKA